MTKTIDDFCNLELTPIWNKLGNIIPKEISILDDSLNEESLNILSIEVENFFDIFNNIRDEILLKIKEEQLKFKV